MARLSFSQIQDAFQKAILDGDDSVVVQLLPGAHESRDALMSVYRTAYVERLKDILSGDHDILHAYVGDDMFEALAVDYIKAHPSDQPNARWFSRHFPKFLAKHERWSKIAVVVEIAKLEDALNTSFDCRDAPVAGLDDLTQYSPEVWADLWFEPHSSVTRLDFNSNAADIWLALREERDPPKREQVQDKIIVWRNETTPMMRKLSSEEAMMWDEATKGVTFGALCELLAFHDDPEGAPTRAATYLQSWLAGGLISSALLQSDAVSDTL